jgi:hypothetical protein
VCTYLINIMFLALLQKLDKVEEIKYRLCNETLLTLYCVQYDAVIIFLHYA